MPRSNFSQRAQDYDSEASVQKKHAAALVRDTIPHLENKPLKIADLGSGTGAVGQQLQKGLGNFVLNNCDVSTDMILVAKENLGLTNTSYTDASLPPDENYDLIISNFALQWYENIEETLKNCILKLSPNGILAISLPIEGSFDSLKETFRYANAEKFLFSFPTLESIKEPLKACTVLQENIIEEELSFENSVQLFKNLHTLGANQTDKRLTTGKFRKLIRYHDELSNGKIIVSYKILKLIVKRVTP